MPPEMFNHLLRRERMIALGEVSWIDREYGDPLDSFDERERIVHRSGRCTTGIPRHQYVPPQGVK